MVGWIEQQPDTQPGSGTSAIRSDRQQGQIIDGVIEEDQEGIVDTEDISEINIEEAARNPIMMNVPQIPKM